MGTLLRIMVVFFLLLAIAGLTLGILLFNRREILKGRTQKLEKTLVKLGTLTEAEPAKVEEKPTYVARDTSPCSSTIIEEPERSKFWETYKHEMEIPDQATMDLNKKKAELMTYFKVDPVTLEVKRDEYNRKVTEGEGTMQAVLDDLVSRSKSQLDRLNETRQQLKAIREELIGTIEDLNKTKKDLRSALNTIVQREQKIAELEDKIVQLKQQITNLEGEKRDLQNQIADLNKQITDLKQEIDNKNTTIAGLKKEIEILRNPGGIGGKPAVAGGEIPLAGRVAPGDKGKIISINSEYRFAIIEVSDQFMKEVLGDDLNQVLPVIHLLVRRSGENGKFVTKVRLVQIKASQKLAIADILGDWQQHPVQVGDIVFY
jgi:prefoldin subunit 5